MTAFELFCAEFPSHRPKRSEAYREGVLEMLQLRNGEVQQIANPFREGAAESDAWYAGLSEGMNIADKHGLLWHGSKRRAG